MSDPVTPPPASPPRRRVAWPWVLGIGIPLAVVVAAGGVAWHVLTAPPEAALSCTWKNVTITGAEKGQAGAVRCYLAALAAHDTGAMHGVTPSQIGDRTVSDSAFRFARDAAAGPAVVTVRQNEVDSADAEVDITFATGRFDAQILEIDDPTSADAWRFTSVDDHSIKGYGP